MALEFSVGFSAKDKGLKKYISDVLSSKEALTKDEWGIKLLGNDKEIDEIKSALDRFKDSNINLDVQLNYDTVFSQLQKAFSLYQSKINLYDLFDISNTDTSKITDYIYNTMAKVEDGIFDGDDPKKYLDDYKQIASIISSAKAGDGFKLPKDVFESFDEFRTNFIGIKSLDSFTPTKTYFSDLKQELSDDQNALLVLSNSLKKFINNGAKPRTATELDAVQDKIDTITKSVDQTDTITIFDGVHEQTYDVIKDFDALISKFEEMANKMQTPVFQAGDLRRGIVNSEDFIPAEALDRDLITGNGSSAGTGHYFASNLVDVIDWLDQLSGNGFTRGLFAIDLNKYKNLLKIPSSDYYESLTEAFSKMHSLIAEGIIEPEAGKKSNADRLGGKNYLDIFDDYKDIFTDLGVNAQQFKDFIDDERVKLKDLVDSSDSIDDAIKKTKKGDSFGTRFLKKFTPYEGVDATNLDLDDSTALGNLVFSLDNAHPFDINFGGNKDMARLFYSMVLGKILSKKIKNLNNELSIDELLSSYIDDAQNDLLKKDGVDKLKNTLKNEQAQSKRYTYKDLNQQQSEEKISDSTKESVNASEQAAEASQKQAEAYNEATQAADEYVSKVERLYQLQQTIANMKIESAYEKSYEESGKYIDDLNTRYQQTIKEINELKDSGDDSDQIKERIGLLSNLALAYQDAIDNSVPNDVVRTDWLKKYTQSSDDLVGDDALYKFRQIKQEAESFNKSLESEILSTYREAHDKGLKIGELSDENINVSALEEIPEIMDRINSAGEKATSTMHEFGDTAQLSGDTEAQAAADLNAAEAVEKLADAERELAEAREERDRAINEKRFADDMYNIAVAGQVEAENQLDEADRENANLRQENNDIIRENIELRQQLAEADEKVSEAEKEGSTAAEENTQASQKQTEADKEAAEAAKEKAEAQKEAAEAAEESAQKEEKASESTQKKTDADKESADTSKQRAGESATRDEASAFDETAGSAQNAASAKDAFYNSNLNVAIAASLSAQALRDEASAFEEVKSNADDAAKSKKDYGKDKTTSTADKKTRENKKKDQFSDKDYRNAYRMNAQYDSIETDGIERISSALKEAGVSATDFAEDFEKINTSLGSGQFKKAESQVDSLINKIKKAGDKNYTEALKDLTSFGSIKSVKSGVDASTYAEKLLGVDLNDARDVFGKQSNDIQSYLNKQLSLINTREKKQTNSGKGFTEEVTDNINKATKAVNEYNEALSKINSESSVDDMSVAFEKGADAIKACSTALESMSDSSNKLIRANKIDNILQQFSKYNNIKLPHGLQNELDEMVGYLNRVRNAADDAKESFVSMSEADFNNIISDVSNLQTKLSQYDKKSFLSQFGNSVSAQSASFLAQYFSIRDYMRYAKEISNVVTQTDSALIELAKVSNASNERIAQSFETSAKSAHDYGATVTDMIKSTADWARLNKTRSHKTLSNR